MGGAVSNWEAGRNIPSREQYAKMSEALFATGKIDPMPPYEDVVRPFMVDGSVEFTDVWTFPSVRPYKGKHPAEKPLEMLEHAIEATTFPGDIVLDCFAGSGSTAQAALKHGRRSLSIEIEPQWVTAIAARIQENEEQRLEGQIQTSRLRINPIHKVPQLALFVAEK
jgi:site-specific DNA-methyltransferase (adenine-specific)